MKRVTDKQLVKNYYPEARCVRDGTLWRVYFRRYEIKTSVCSYSARRTWELAAVYVERELRGTTPIVIKPETKAKGDL